MNTIINITLFIVASIVGQVNTDNHPCSDEISVEVRAIMPNCYGYDGQIIFTNPPPADATYRWSHDNSETGHNVGDLESGLYTITLTKGVHVRVVDVYLE